MNLKTKKKNADGLVRLETSGQIKEILIKEDILKPKEAKIIVCFRGKDSSGILELAPNEIETLYKELKSKSSVLGKIEIIR